MIDLVVDPVQLRWDLPVYVFVVSGGGGMGIHRRSNCNGIGVRSLGVGMGIRGSAIVTLGSGIVTLGSGAYKGGACRGMIEEKSSGKRVGRFGGRMDGFNCSLCCRTIFAIWAAIPITFVEIVPGFTGRVKLCPVS